MQERQVTIAGESHPLERPFLVMATQNPIETQWTYELPEAQVDRFMFKILLDYPTQKQEQEIMKMVAGRGLSKIGKIIFPSRIIEIQDFNHCIYILKISLFKEEYINEKGTSNLSPSDSFDLLI